MSDRPPLERTRGMNPDSYALLGACTDVKEEKRQEAKAKLAKLKAKVAKDKSKGKK